MEIEKLLKCIDVDVYGVADIEPIEDCFHPSVPRGIYKKGIVIGMRLSEGVLDTIKDSPTLIYKHHYKVINWMLDQAVFKISKRIERLGYKTFPVAASQEVDWKNQLGHLPHRLAGYYAGIGWIGRSGLLINPRYGPRLRYATILTNMPLEVTGEPIPFQCGDCLKCIEACPAKAIDETGTDWRLCYSQLKKFASIRGIGQLICGVCIAVCPVGRDKNRGEK